MTTRNYIVFSRALVRRLLVTTVAASAYAIVVVVINNAHLFRQLIASPSDPFQPPSPDSMLLFEGLGGSTRDPSSSSHFAHSFHLGRGRRRAGEKLYASSWWPGQWRWRDDVSCTSYPAPKEGCSGDGNGIIIRAHESSPRPYLPARPAADPTRDTGIILFYGWQND